jgi:glutamine synthetase type III
MSNHQPLADGHSHADEQTPVAHTDSPRVIDLCDHPNAPSLHRQLPGATHEVADLTIPIIQRTSPTLLEKAAVVRSLKGKEKEWTAVAEKKRPLQLLDLPVDILKEIIEKVGNHIYHVHQRKVLMETASTHE